MDARVELRATGGVMLFQRLSTGNWGDLLAQWEAECAEFEEDFGDYAFTSLPILGEVACSPQRKDVAVYGLGVEDKVLAVCQVNAAFIPNYTGKVLRVRHIVLSPRFDFSGVHIDEYAQVLLGIFGGTIELAEAEMPCDHVKFHLNSPVERNFGEAFTKALKAETKFKKVDMKGSWVYISKDN